MTRVLAALLTALAVVPAAANRKLPYPQCGSVRSIFLFQLGHGLQRLRHFRATAPLDKAISPDGRWIAFGRDSQ
jgi:hypothetical protein